MVNLAEIAQSGIDPVSGSPLSAERRKELFRRSQISAAGVFGGGRGGALVPVNRGPDPQTLAIVRTNTNTITSFQIQINNLTKQNNAVLSNLAKINNLQQQINVVQVSVVDLGNNLQQIANLIVNEGAVEQQKERLAQEQEKKLAEAGIRQGKEKQLESKIREALMWPIKQIGNKVQSAFGSLMSFMWQLLGGWLTIQGLDVLKALSTGNKKKLEDIKNNVIKSLLVVGGILGVLSVGIFRVVGLITKLTFKLGKFIIGNTIGRLFGGLLNLGKKALGIGAKPATVAAAGAGARGAAAVTMGAGTADDIAKAGSKGGNWLSKLFGGGSGKAGQAVAGKAASRIVGGAMPVGGSLVNLWSAIESAKEGNMLGASLYGTASVTSLIPPLAWLSMATTAAAIGSEVTYEKSDNAKSMPTDKMVPPKPKPTNKIVPTKPKSPSPTQTSSPSSSALLAQTSSSSSNLQIAPAEVQKVPTPPTNIPPEPEVKPNIVYASSGGSNSQPQSQPSSSGSATDVPLFSSSNPDNFYALYSQVSYNVIM
jgi:hypothetical protein